MDCDFRQIGCVLISHLAMKFEENRNSDLINKKVIIYSNDRKGKSRVFDYSRGIRRVFIGMPLSHALNIYPEATIIEADINKYNQLFDFILLKLSKKVDRIEKSSFGKAYIDVSGYSQGYGGESRMISNILDVMPSFLGSRLGISSGKFFAYCAAILSDSGRATKITDKNMDRLYELPINILIDEFELIRDLHLFGLSTIGEFAKLTKGVVSSRFGFNGVKVWNRVNGVDFDPVRSNKNDDSVSEQSYFPYESSSRKMFYLVLDSLVEKIYTGSIMRGRYIGEFSISCAMQGLPDWSKDVVLKTPCNNPETASATLHMVLGDISLPGLVERMTVTASGLVGEHGVQSKAFLDIDENRNPKIDRVLKIEQYLEGKLDGHQDVSKIVDVNHSHPLPEMRFVQIPINPHSRRSVKSINIPKTISINEIDGIPVSFIASNHKSVNVYVHDKWKVDLWWMRNPAIRSYYRLTTEEGVFMTVFKDMLKERWYSQRY